MAKRDAPPRVAFVLGGGGHMGAHQVGMLRALLERDIAPDLVLGTSIGALNGAAIAASPSLDMVERLERLWRRMATSGLLSGSLASRAVRLARSGTHLHGNRELRTMLERTLPTRIEDLPVRFECVAASIEHAAEHWFTRGPLADAVLASAALPGVMPIVAIGDEHFMDGGLVNSIPIGRAVTQGVKRVYVLHVGRIEQPLAVPRTPWGVALTAFEIARRHRFAHDLTVVPPDVEVHVLPTGTPAGELYRFRDQLRYRDFTAAGERIDRAHRATGAYLDGR